MSVRNRITEKNPRTGALPSEQTAENQEQQGAVGSGMLESDKLIYQLVENNVSYAGDQFGENLRFNSETLTNVLYDNIFKLLGEKFEEDEFIKWVADELVNRGCVTKVDDSQQKTEPSQPKEEVVYELDDSAYTELQAKVGAAIELLKANRLNIFKAFNHINDLIQENATQVETNNNQNHLLQLEQSQRITELVEKLQGNYDKLDEYVQAKGDSNANLDKSMQNVQTAIVNVKVQRAKQDKVCKTVYERLSGTLNNIRGRIKQANEDYKALDDKKFRASILRMQNLPKPMKAKSKPKAFGGNKKILGLFGGKKKKPKNGKIVDIKAKPKKLPLGKRIKRGITRKIARTGRKIKKAVTENPVWKVMKTVTKVIAKTIGVMKKVVTTVFKVGKKLAVAAFKTAKFAVKSFYKASKFVGGVMRKVTSAALNFAKKTVKTGGKNIMNTLKFGSGAKLLNVVGWKAIKLIGKSIWKGIKKLAVAGLGLLKKMFKIGGKLVNKVDTYLGKLGVGITDKAYRFLIKPMANFMVTMVGFALGVVTTPVQFMKFMIPTLMERLSNVVSNIKEAARAVLKSTWSLFRRILFNPITIGLIVGGLFLFFGPKLIEWLSEMVTNIRDKVIPAITSFCKKAIEVLTPIWEVIKTVGVWLFDFINWITDPDNFLAQTIYWGFKIYYKVKGFIKDMMRAAGQNTMDILCKFLAGDTLGIAISFITGMVKSFWNYLKKKGAVKIMLKVLKVVMGIHKMILDIPRRLIQSIGGAISAILSGNWGDIPERFQRPWKEWWANVEGIFKWDEEPKSGDEILEHDPIQQNQTIAEDTKNSVRQLSMRGMTGEKTMAKMDQIARMKGYTESTGVLKRIKQMEKLYRINSKQVTEFDKFLTGIWEMSGKNSENAEKTITLLLESPDFSQKLLSVFFYYNPQTQETMMTRPMSYIGQFIKNLQEMALDQDGDWSEKFKLMVDAFDQMNKERSHIINNQGNQITKFASEIANFNLNQKNSEQILEQMVDEFNKGDLFKNISVDSSFDQMMRGNAKTQKIKGKDGKELGSNNKLLKIEDDGKSVKVSDFKAKKGDGRGPVLGRVQLPESLNPKPVAPVDADATGRSKSVLDGWYEYIDKIRDLQSKGYTDQQIVDMGYPMLSYEQYKDKYHTTDEERRAAKEQKEKQLAGYRTAVGAMKFNEKGTTMSKNASLSMKVKPGGKPSIYNIEADVNKDLYLFSDDWVAMVGENTLSDSELMLLADSSNQEAMKAVQKEQEARIKEREAEERERKREQEILDYSAKVKDGYIEIKIGEDTVAMENAWYAHLDKLREFLAVPGNTQEMADEMGLKNYSWEEWQRYYRRMHGLPEDGIKRVKFEGKKKERVIDWNTRSALSADELGTYGITMSENGPVMIPLDKAMTAASALFQGAKTIHSIRDGLEVMKMGLDSETDKLKKKRDEGVPSAVIVIPTSVNESTVSIPSTSESQPET